jgi:predicted MPP superfamily phosphohydrolase
MFRWLKKPFVFIFFLAALIGLPLLIILNRPVPTSPEEKPVSDFRLVVLPDTQFYSAQYPEIFLAQTQWIIDNKDEMNIAFVAHTGDIINSGNQDKEWQNANRAISLLDEVVPYGLVLGNHDQVRKFNEYFPPSRYENKSWWGGKDNQAPQNNYQLFSAAGLGFIVLNLEYDPADEVLSWADRVLKSYPEKRAIVASHYLLDYDGFRSKIGHRIFDNLKDNPNLFLILCGHIHTETRRTDMADDRPIHQVLANFQARANGGNGWLRILRFVPEENKIYVETYSPYLDEYEIDDNSQFVLDYNSINP